MGYRFFVYKRTVRSKDNRQGVTPELWEDDNTEGHNAPCKGKKTSYEESEPGDIVFFHILTEADKDAWEDAYMHGEASNLLNFFMQRFPFSHPSNDETISESNNKPREQDLFPEGEG